MRTVLITGSSSGIGRETAKIFQRNGWNIIATMRRPEEEKELTELDNVKVIRCDVTDTESIDAAVTGGISAFGMIDVLVNNAGYYTIGPLEAATYDQIRDQIDTNLIGTINVTKRMLPHMREQRSGTIVNVSSIAGLVSLPLQSLYHATKWGMEGFSEALHYELRPFNIRVKLIEPGVIRTDFYGRSKTVLHDETLPEYCGYSEKVVNNVLARGEKGSPPEIIAGTIYKASTDSNGRMRYRAGRSKAIVTLRKLLPFRVYSSFVRRVMEK
ncbi:MAG: SDR family oxidoreductase [Methanomassiliicoccaceae archaeon]|jgi:NAD(P)-dependent dehydrogenase (short-subunit alcohol dehydrogenase family)|nr:SDR family oxidoreductase [Methanomassiliicoccaceae archaeon]